jgi:hypothetical protein
MSWEIPSDLISIKQMRGGGGHLGRAPGFSVPVCAGASAEPRGLYLLSVKYSLLPVSLATPEAKIRMIMVQSQPRQIVHEILSRKTPSLKRAGGVARGIGLEFKPQYLKINKQKAGQPLSCPDQVSWSPEEHVAVMFCAYGCRKWSWFCTSSKVDQCLHLKLSFRQFLKVKLTCNIFL